jgi:hypothetical protein
MLVARLRKELNEFPKMVKSRYRNSGRKGQWGLQRGKVKNNSHNVSRRSAAFCSDHSRRGQLACRPGLSDQGLVVYSTFFLPSNHTELKSIKVNSGQLNQIKPRRAPRYPQTSDFCPPTSTPTSFLAAINQPLAPGADPFQPLPPGVYRLNLPAVTDCRYITRAVLLRTLSNLQQH